MTLFRLDASIRVEGSASRALGDVVERTWRESADARTPSFAARSGLNPLASSAWPLAVISQSHARAGAHARPARRRRPRADTG